MHFGFGWQKQKVLLNMAKHPNIQMLELVAQGLGALKEEVVFVGGTTTAFYVTDPAAPDARPTEDVDCIIEIESRTEYHKLEKELRKLGFKNVVEKNAPVCRWIYRGVRVDVMPTREEIIGFSNRWYPEALKNRVKVSLPSTLEIYVLTLLYFLATKYEAYLGRGKGEPRLSHDIEDIVTVLDGHVEIEKVLAGSEGELREYLKEAFGELRKRDDFPDMLDAHLVFGPDQPDRAKRITRVLDTFIKVE